MTGDFGDPDDAGGPDADTRSAMAKAADLATRVTSISIMFVLPIVGGYFVDQYFGSKFVFLLLGLVLGMAIAGMQLMRLVDGLGKG